MKPYAKYGVVSVAGGSLVGQASELVRWVASITLPPSVPHLPEQAAILIATVAIVWPLSLVMPASTRSPPDNG
jgi:hypothetical protein